jgi:hypothetical protein
MNRIILIGNGFDLAHGLETSYKHFIDDYWKNVEKKIKTKKAISSDNSYYYDTFYYEDKDILFEMPHGNSIDIKTIRDNTSFKNNFLKIISKEIQFKNWVDIEKEYFLRLKSLLNTNIKDKQRLVSTLNTEFDSVRHLLQDYLIKVESKNNFKKQNKILIKVYSNSAFEDFSEEAANKKGSNIKLEIPIISRTLFLNFNYTNTHSNYINLSDEDKMNIRRTFDSTNDIINISTISIHGNLYEKYNPIIFGYGDEIDEDYKKIENLDINTFLDNIKSIEYHKTSNYKDVLRFINSDEYQIFIFGHSCGLSDRTLLNTLFEHDNCVSIKPFYYKYKEDGLEKDNYIELVQNISRNFNDKVKMRDRVVNKTYCERLPQCK